MGARWHTGRLLRVFAAPLLLGGVLTGLGSTAASALTCQAWTGGQPANPNDTGSGDGLAAGIRVYLGRSFPASGEPTLSQTVTPFGGATLADGVYVG